MARPFASIARTAGIAIAAWLAAAACRRADETPQDPAPPPEVQRFGGATMGSTYEVKFVGDAEPAAVRAIVEAELAAFDEAFSRWRDDSEITRVNAHAGTEPVPVTERFAAVLDEALRLAAATDGAFDPTVAPLTDLYREAKRDPSRAPTKGQLEAARRRVDFRKVRVADGAVIKARPDVQLDLDGIVAGACADAIAARLAPLRLRGLYLEITGEVLCRGEKADGVPWRIGVVDPSDGERAIRDLPLRDRALCTSGDYRNTVVVDGELVHHVFDPRTGHNPKHRTVSVSVLAERASVADALGTALLVMGLEDARATWAALQRAGAGAALFIERGDASFELIELDWPGRR